MSTHEALSKDEITEVIRGLLQDAATAHGVHEAEDLGGVYDIDWPQWYANHMAHSIATAGYRLLSPTA